MKWLKRFLWICVAIVMMLLSGIVIALFYKQEILAEVYAQLRDSTGADVIIEDADVTLFEDFPRISLRLEKLVVREPDDHQNELFQCDKVTVNLHAYKLLKREIGFGS